MNYSKIYNDFILDRRTKEKTIDVYTEVHHILPKALGGTDDKVNLVRLTAGDHYFAHLLLAKIYGGKMIFALQAMSNLSNGTERPCFKKRLQYSHVRKMSARNYSCNFSGKNSPVSDKEIYELHNHDGRVVSGDRIDISEKTNLAPRAISALLLGQKHNYNGWFYPPKNNGKSSREIYRIGNVTDQTIYNLHHFDGRIWSGRKVDFLDAFGKKLYFQKTNGNCNGWYKNQYDAKNHFLELQKKCKKNSEKRGNINGLNNPRSDKKIYHFINFETLEEKKMTRFELADFLEIKSSKLSCLFSLRQKSVRSWGLYDVWLKKDNIKTIRKDRIKHE
jgi:hypothetical protein